MIIYTPDQAEKLKKLYKKKHKNQLELCKLMEPLYREKIKLLIDEIYQLEIELIEERLQNYYTNLVYNVLASKYTIKRNK
jgi:dephospho-CoA kinase